MHDSIHIMHTLTPPEQNSPAQRYDLLPHYHRGAHPLGWGGFWGREGLSGVWVLHSDCEVPHRVCGGETYTGRGR